MLGQPAMWKDLGPFFVPAHDCSIGCRLPAAGSPWHCEVIGTRPTLVRDNRRVHNLIFPSFINIALTVEAELSQKSTLHGKRDY
jgi:hypothetical protein